MKIICKLNSDLFVIRDNSQIYIASKKQTGLERPEVGDDVIIDEWFLNLNKKECKILKDCLEKL